MIPSLQALLKAATDLYGIGEGAIRLGHDEACLQALGVFMWMAREATEVEQAAVALFAGRRLSVAVAELARTDVAIANDTQFARLVHEALFEATTLDEIARRKRRTQPELAPVEIARRILGGRADAMTIGTAHIRQLAAALLALEDHGNTLTARRQSNAVKAHAVKTAYRQFEKDRGSPSERAALNRLMLAVDLLADALDPNVPQTQEKIYG
jgi:hypothetical protein